MKFQLTIASEIKRFVSFNERCGRITIIVRVSRILRDARNACMYERRAVNNNDLNFSLRDS